MGRYAAGALDKPAINQVRMPKLALNRRAIGSLCLVATATGWAFGWSAMKLLLRDWPPLFSRGVAGVAASLILAIIAISSGERLSVPRKSVPRLLFAAFTNVFAWMGFSTLTMKWLNVGEGVLLVFTMPIWATLFAWPFLGTRPTTSGVAALGLGLAGVVVLLGGHGFSMDAGKLVGVAFALGAAVFFALGTTLNRSPLPIPRVASVMWQVGLGCLPLVILGLIFEKPSFGALTPLGWAGLIYSIVVGMSTCYLTWFATLRYLPPAMASTGMLLVPLIGVVSAAVIFGEPLGWRQATSVALTLGGVTLALRNS
jgi:drug/metabolite transporter (DMT)-like permease